MNIKIEKSWRGALEKEFEKKYFLDLAALIKEKYLNSTVFPFPKNVFKAFDLTPLDEVKVVIIGQDPYHGTGQASGLCFSIEADLKQPPSLQNIFKEIESDLGIKPLPSGDLSRWAKQGVFLLNSVLTVQKDKAGSHSGLGWEEFTDSVVNMLSKNKENLVFMLWGNYAKAKGEFIDRKKHLVLESAHPSPFSASHGFFGNKHFSKANKFLREKALGEINWE